MNYVYDLDPEEQELSDQLDSSEIEPIDNLEQVMSEVRDAAKRVVNKSKTISIRLSDHDIRRVKIKAADEGLPYQTYLASYIHKLVAA